MQDNVDLTDAVLMLSKHYAPHIPRNFAECFDIAEWNVSPDDAFILLTGPQNPAYWDVWDHVLATAKCIDDNGQTWYLHFDGDLWAIPAK